MKWNKLSEFNTFKCSITFFTVCVHKFQIPKVQKPKYTVENSAEAARWSFEEPEKSKCISSYLQLLTFTSRQSEDLWEDAELTALLCSERCLSFRGKYDWLKHKIGPNTLKDANYTPFNESELIGNIQTNHLISDFTRLPEVLLLGENRAEFPPHFAPFQVSGNSITLSVSVLCVESLHLFGPRRPADWSLSSRRQPPLRLFDTGNLFVLGAGLLTDALLCRRPRFVPRVTLLTVTRSHSSFRACACIGWQQLHWVGGRSKRVEDMNVLLNLKSHDATGIFHVCLILFNQFLFRFVCLFNENSTSPLISLNESH